MATDFNTLMTTLKEYLDDLPPNFDSWDKASRLSLILYGYRVGLSAQVIGSEHIDEIGQYVKDEIDAVFKVSQLALDAKKKNSSSGS